MRQIDGIVTTTCELLALLHLAISAIISNEEFNAAGEYAKPPITNTHLGAFIPGLERLVSRHSAFVGGVP